MSNRLKLLLLGAIGVLALVVVALGVVYVALRPAARPVTGNGAIAVEVSDKTCTPDRLVVPAGAPEFQIRNVSDHAIEWEILSGVLVVAERENIAPGFTVTLTPRLEPGTYQMTCGLLSNPRGTLNVVAADGSTNALPKPPSLVDLVGPTAEYRVFAIGAAQQLANATSLAAKALKAGDTAAARTQLEAADAAFAQLSPVLHLFQQDAAPLASGPTSLASLVKSLEGASASAAGNADAAAHSATALAGAVSATTAAPREIVAGAGDTVAALAGNPGDPADAANRIKGVRKVVDLFQPLTARADKALAAKIDTDLGAVEAALARPQPDAAALKPQLADLGADMTDLLSALGLNTVS
ncbi:MAG TPA: cupredoxin domain-containing protein [Devosia sp.]|nr:cupredoxin domain-containing protein [Devosia sp.]